MCHWPGPRSLATTNGVSVDVLSSRYLDVSVPWVRLKPPMNSEVSYLHLITGNPKPHGLENLFRNLTKSQGLGVPAIEGGFPHSEIRGSKLLRSSPRLIAAYHVLHRLCMPRHPPIALISLDRSHCQCSSKLQSSLDHSLSTRWSRIHTDRLTMTVRTVLQNPEAPSKIINDNELWKDKE